MSYAYATIEDTLADVLTEVKGPDQQASVGRLIEAASAFVDGFTDRPPGYFLGVGSSVGTKQKINIAVDADQLTADAVVRLTITAAALPGSPVALERNAVFGVDDSESIAAAFETLILLNTELAAFFNVTNQTGSLDLEMADLGTPDNTFSASVDTVGPNNGINPTRSSVIEAGHYSPATVRRYRGAGKHFLQIGRHVAGSVSVQNVDPTLYYEQSNGWLYAVDVAAGLDNITGDGYDNVYYPACNLFVRGGLYLVSARWGFVATPDSISMATKQIVQQIWDRGKGILGQLSPTGFVIERDIPLTARAFLTPYIRREFEVN